MKIKIKDIELDLPNDVGVEIFEDGKRVVISQPPTQVTSPFIPYYYQPGLLPSRPWPDIITWTSNSEATK